MMNSVIPGTMINEAFSRASLEEIKTDTSHTNSIAQVWTRGHYMGSFTQSKKKELLSTVHIIDIQSRYIFEDSPHYSHFNIKEKIHKHNIP